MLEQLDSRFVKFRLNHSEKKDLDIGTYVSSETISVGGYLWRVKCYPRGRCEEDKGEYVSIYLQLVTKSSGPVKVIFDAFLLDKDGAPGTHAHRFLQAYDTQAESWGWGPFVKRNFLEFKYLAADGVVTFVCGVAVVPDGRAMPTVPPPEIGAHLGRLLDRGAAADVTFVVDGEEFPAHRAVLVARSPVFKAQLLGGTADATMPSITLHDIQPEAFKAMLWFIYTDTLPASDEEEQLGADASSVEMMLHLVAAADWYALDRLKIMCSLKLMQLVTADTVGSILVCADMYNCPELKAKCLDFFAVEENFKMAAVTDGFMNLMQKFPSLAAELRKLIITYHA